MDTMFDPKVGDRVCGEILRISGSVVGFSGTVRRIDQSEELSHQVQLDNQVDGTDGVSLIWFRPQDLTEEYLD